MGMGRGAGNVKLEEFIYNLDKKNQDKMFYIQKFIEEVMMKMKQKYNWGTNFSYFYAAKNFCTYILFAWNNFKHFLFY